MKKRTSKYISLLLLLTSSLLLPLPAHAQKKDKETLKKEYEASPLYQGTSIGVEVAGAAGYLLGGDALSSEIILQTNFKNRFLPVIEVGYAKTDATNDANNMHFKTAAPYFRVGMDYNVFYQKPYLPGYLYVGLRYGMSSFTYDASGPDMTDPNYGGHITVPYADLGEKSSAHWVEGVVGIKVRIYKHFHMGWAVRYKMRMSVTNHENSTPWYVPGFGKNAGSSFNLTYNLIYNLPF